MSLKAYHQKRNFKKTPEPKGKVTSKKKKLFFIQKHAASHLHYDFRLELNGVLLSWAVPKGPCLDPTVKRLAMHVEDHPLEYGHFEGIIPKGQYGGGTVMLWDKGEWISEDENPATAYSKGNMAFSLKGEKLMGRWKLVRIHHNDKTWLLIKIKDEYAKSIKKYDITIKEPNSVLSNYSIEDIAENYDKAWSKNGAKKIKRKPLQSKDTKNIAIKTISNLKPAKFPSSISPELATLVDEPPQGKNWLHEIKFDGYRMLAFKHKNKTKLITRNGNDWTKKFQTIADKINMLPIPNLILDGEIVVLDDKQHSNFQLLQNSIKNNTGNSFIYYIFDLLYYHKFNLLNTPLIDRKNILQTILQSNDEETLRFSDHIIGSGKEILKKSCKLALEGIVSKDATSTYLQKRSKDWLKIKCLKRQEFVIGGFTPPQRSRKYFGSLLLGTFNKRHELIYNGNVGTGFTTTSLKDIYDLLIKHKVEKMPFHKRPENSKKVIWVKPLLVAEIEFTEWTKDNYLRHPSFKGLRNDKPANTINKEIEIPIENIHDKTRKTTALKLSHPTKILYKEDNIDKQQLAEYYQEVSNWILPFIKNRPLTLVRCPNGYTDCFYQKHIDRSYPAALHHIMIAEKHKKDRYLYIKDIEGLLALPQLGVLEIHPWNSLISEINFPDMIIFDIDPAPGLPWKNVVTAALEIKKHLSEFELRSFVKTTGGKGLHVVVPILPEYEWDKVKNFTHVFANFLGMKSPEKYVSKMTKSIRKGKIFIDYLRNQKGATSVAPYSTRARLHAPVSTPLHWDELSNNIRDNFFTLKTLPERLNNLKNDPWKDFFKLKQSLNLEKIKKGDS